jgi:hypothetical protein
VVVAMTQIAVEEVQVVGRVVHLVLVLVMHDFLSKQLALDDPLHDHPVLIHKPTVHPDLLMLELLTTSPKWMLITAQAPVLVVARF